jgi:hypothetical protein
MQNSTLLVLIYVLIVLVTWLAGLRIYKDELFTDKTSDTGSTVFVLGMAWPLLIFMILMVMGSTLSVRLLKKMHNIKF